MNRIFFGDNLPILRGLPAESVDLIYLDPPFNTKKTQKRATIRTVRDKYGDRTGFKGIRYRTINVGTKAYEDSLDSDKYINEFLRPRLVEAYRLLKSHGSLYFHIDYREVHYCKILLDEIFGRESFLNEIIWAYDYGGRAKSKWPAKHDNILFYAKDPRNYIFNTGAIDREPYMAPGLVGPEKARKGKLPTDVWWPGYVAAKLSAESTAWYLRGQNSTWWQTIVPTNSRERVGYPTQKPRKLLDRIIKASSVRGSVVMDFFAGSGTTGESCAALGRSFILIDSNESALEVMAQRFGHADNVEWVNFNPKPHQSSGSPSTSESRRNIRTMDRDFIILAGAAGYLQAEFVDEVGPWENSPFEWILSLPSAIRMKLGRQLVYEWCVRRKLPVDVRPASRTGLLMRDRKIEIRPSILSPANTYQFEKIRDGDYDFAVCIGISPFQAHCWVIGKQILKQQVIARSGRGTASFSVDPQAPPAWVSPHGGTLEEAYQVLKGLSKRKK